MNISILIYLIVFGIAECFIGIILYIIAMVKKSNKLFLTGLIVQGFLCFGNFSGAAKYAEATGGEIGIDTIANIAFL